MLENNIQYKQSKWLLLIGGEHVNVCLLLFVCVILNAFVSSKLFAQELNKNFNDSINNKAITTSTMIGYGTSSILDTYLSPLNYTGDELRLMYDRFRQTKIMHGNVAVQQQYSLYGSRTNNISGSAREWTGMAYMLLGYYYNYKNNHTFGINNLKLMYGPQAELGFGAVYNERNSNNPANAKVYVDIKASAIAKYNIKVTRRFPIIITDQVSIPMFGVMFSPEYQQSYYEIFGLGQSKGIVNPTTIFSKPSVRNQLSVDLPIKNSMLRLSYLLEVDQTKVNNLKYHSYSNIFMIGYVRRLCKIKAFDK